MPSRTPTVQVARHPAIQNIYTLDEGAGCRIDWDKIPDSYRAGSATVRVNTVAAQNATAVLVDALTVPLGIGTNLSFDTGEFARLTVAAPVGATSLTVEALVNGLEVGDKAVIAGSGPKQIPGLTAMVYTSGGNGLAVPRVLGTGEAASFLLASSAVQGSIGAGYTGYGSYVSGNFYENLLPDAVSGTFSSTYKTELAANSGKFLFFTYVDSRAS